MYFMITRRSDGVYGTEIVDAHAQLPTEVQGRVSAKSYRWEMPCPRDGHLGPITAPSKIPVNAPRVKLRRSQDHLLPCTLSMYVSYVCTRPTKCQQNTLNSASQSQESATERQVSALMS